MKRILPIAALFCASSLVAAACGFGIAKNPDPGPPPATGDDDLTGDDDTANSTPTPGASDQPNDLPSDSSATFTQVYSRILQPKCVACHGSGGTIPNLSSYSSFAKNTRWIVPGSPKSSTVYLEIYSGSMPRGSARLGTEDLSLISDWITQGALNN